MSANKRNGADYRGGLMRAYRPVQTGEWFGQMAEKLWEVSGTYFDIDVDPSDLRLTLIGTGEIAHAKRHSDKLGAACMRSVAKSARQFAPESFSEPVSLTPARLLIRNYLEGDQLAIGFDNPILHEESRGLRHGVTVAAGERQSWYRPDFLTAKIGTPTTHFSSEIIEEIQTALPESVPLLPGIVKPIAK